MLLRIGLALVLIAPGLIRCQNPSPCPDIFKYEQRKEQDRWYGVLSLQTNEELRGVWIHLMLDRPAELLGNWFGEATSSDNQEYTIKNPKYRLETGPPVSVRFFVKYNSASTVPSLTEIRLNGKTICSATAANQDNTPTELHISKIRPNRPSEEQITPVQSSETTDFRPNNNRPTNEEEASQPSSVGTSLDYFPGDFNIPRPNITRPHGIRPLGSGGSSGRNPACGTVAMKASPLISHGQGTSKGQWPWHAALYHSQAGIQLMYTCGGTLVSSEHVITAAHCVARPNTNRPIDNQNLLVYLGKHNLKTFGSEVQDREVSHIFIHPQYNNTVYFNDIAVLKLARSVEFNNFVRPCCLWDGSDDLELLTNKFGTVVGWGFDENRQLSTNLMQAQMPVIDTIKCIYSNREFFSQFTFEKTYCAGFRNGTSVCNGDSGGGMVFPKSGTSGQNTVWQLRGLVSVGVALQGHGVCDTSHFTVFTDVAKHLDWIRQQMNR